VAAKRTSAREDETAALSKQERPPLAAVIRVTGSPASTTALPLRYGSCTVGAGTTADLVVEDDAVSRKHVELTLVPEGVRVRDLGSRNGTFYLGQRMEQAVLSFGSRIRIGRTELTFEPDTTTLEGGESAAPRYGRLLGTSTPMRRLFGTLGRLEGSLVSVLVEGESGVGKELVAQAIHQGSAVAKGPLVVVNCGAIARELVLSELFGHAKGAFTGASEARAGAFEAADGGTLFLDEVGELPLDTQPALLRALESGEIKRVGENETRTARVRIVAATNRDVSAEVEAGTFREDLFYRLAVVRLRVPPLAERSEDVPLLAQHFATEAGAGELPREVITALARRRYRGNVRELRNAVLAYLALGTVPEADVARGAVLEVTLGDALDPSQPYQDEKDRFTALFSRIYFERLLERTGGNQSEAARIAAVDRSYLSKLLARYGVKR
jgi:DNA-binding NtrC family response regulator